MVYMTLLIVTIMVVIAESQKEIIQKQTVESEDMNN